MSFEKFQLLEIITVNFFILVKVFAFIFIFQIYFIDDAITVVPFSPLHSPPPCTHPPTHIPPLQFMSMSLYISSLASTFPILFLLFPCLFSTYHLCYLFSVPFPPVSPSHSPIDNPPCDLHFCESGPVLVVGLDCFYFVFQVQWLIVVCLLSFTVHSFDVLFLR